MEPTYVKLEVLKKRIENKDDAHEYNTSFPQRKEDLNLESEQGSPYTRKKYWRANKNWHVFHILVKLLNFKHKEYGGRNL